MERRLKILKFCRLNKILKSNFQELRSLIYTLTQIKSGKHYKLLIIHKREIGIHNIYNRDLKILGSLITYMS